MASLVFFCWSQFRLSFVGSRLPLRGIVHETTHPAEGKSLFCGYRFHTRGNIECVEFDFDICLGWWFEKEWASCLDQPRVL